MRRARLTHKHYDVGDVAAMNVLKRSREGMNTRFSSRQKIAERETKMGNPRNPSIVVDDKLETRRRQQRMLKQKAQEIEILKPSEKVKVIRNMVSNLARKSRSELNELTIKQCWGDFDTEALAGIVHAMVDMLPTLSPTRIAKTLAQQSARRRCRKTTRRKCGTLTRVEVRRFSSFGKPFRSLRVSRPNSLCDVYGEAPPLPDSDGTWKTD